MKGKEGKGGEKDEGKTYMLKVKIVTGRHSRESESGEQLQSQRAREREREAQLVLTENQKT